jgi:hypothetical protein
MFKVSHIAVVYYWVIRLNKFFKPTNAARKLYYFNSVPIGARKKMNETIICCVGLNGRRKGNHYCQAPDPPLPSIQLISEKLFLLLQNKIHEHFFCFLNCSGKWHRQYNQNIDKQSTNLYWVFGPKKEKNSLNMVKIYSFKGIVSRKFALLLLVSLES